MVSVSVYLLQDCSLPSSSGLSGRVHQLSRNNSIGNARSASCNESRLNILVCRNV